MNFGERRREAIQATVSAYKQQAKGHFDRKRQANRYFFWTNSKLSSSARGQFSNAVITMTVTVPGALRWSTTHCVVVEPSNRISDGTSVVN